MRIALGGNRYGKSGIRLVKVTRHADRHDLADLTVDVWLEGDFDAAHTAGDNAAILPTDTMRATVYALAKTGSVEEIEAFGLRLAERFLDAAPAASRATVAISAEPWTRMTVAGEPHPHAFARLGGGRRTAEVARTRDQTRVTAGVADLTILKSAGSAFSGFLTDEFTTLPETDDRILATALTAAWRYGDGDGEVDWGDSAEAVRRVLLETFAVHDSRSVQHTLYAMGEAVLAARPEVEAVRLTMPNKHHLPVDLGPYGLANDNEVFVAADRPFGAIEGTVVRAGAAPW
jgi:urate oxidase